MTFVNDADRKDAPSSRPQKRKRESDSTDDRTNKYSPYDLSPLDCERGQLHLVPCCLSLVRDPAFSDVTIQILVVNATNESVTPFGTEIHASRLILGSASNVLRSMFGSNMRERNSNAVSFRFDDEIRAKAFALLINVLMGDNIAQPDDDTLVAMAMVADQYDLTAQTKDIARYVFRRYLNVGMYVTRILDTARRVCERLHSPDDRRDIYRIALEIIVCRDNESSWTENNKFAIPSAMDNPDHLQLVETIKKFRFYVIMEYNLAMFVFCWLMKNDRQNKEVLDLLTIDYLKLINYEYVAAVVATMAMENRWKLLHSRCMKALSDYDHFKHNSMVIPDTISTCGNFEGVVRGYPLFGNLTSESSDKHNQTKCTFTLYVNTKLLPCKCSWTLEIAITISGYIENNMARFSSENVSHTMEFVVNKPPSKLADHEFLVVFDVVKELSLARI